MNLRGLSVLRPILSLFMDANNRQRRMLMIIGILLAAVTVLAGVALLGLSGWFITATAIAGLSSATALVFDVFAPAAGIRFLALVRTLARYGERLTTHDATLSILAALRERLFRGFARAGEALHLQARPALLLFRLTGDVDALDSLYLRVIVPLGAAVVTAIIAGIAVGLAHPVTGIALIIILLVAGIGIPFTIAQISRRSSRLRSYALEALRARTIDLSAGQTELIMAGQMHSQVEHISHAEKKLSEADDRLNHLDTLAGAAFGIASTLILTAMLIAVALLVEVNLIDAPVAAFMLLVSLAALEPFIALRRGALELGRTLLSAQRLGKRINLQEQPQDLPSPDLPKGLSVKLENVHVAHNRAHTSVLNGINLQISKGEIVALVGPSGAGKSTLLALIAGETSAYSGQVSACAHSLLTQRTELFHDSVRDNLLLAAPDADDTMLWESVAIAGLDSDIRALPLGLDTQLGEGGSGLSGGQSRRLALARLLLRQTPLWLVDEASEGVDAATACDVTKRLFQTTRKRGYSLVIATHLRREAEAADRIITIERGRIVTEACRGEEMFNIMLQKLRSD